MDYKEVKDELKQIVEIATSVPEQFREKCFELLLNNLIENQKHARKDSTADMTPGVKRPDASDKDELPPTPPVSGSTSTFPMTAQLRLLMRKTAVAKEELERLLMYDNQNGGEVHFVKEPHDVGVTAGQMEWALLLALRNAVLKDSLSVDPEDVRSVCQEKGFYDSANFAATFKRGNYSKLFKGPMVNQGDAQQLTTDGQDALGKLIKRLASESQ